MKATGVVRRMDDLGRIVIPKEIRRTLTIREGDSMEIYTGNEGEILLKKYSPLGQLAKVAARFCKVLAEQTGKQAVVTDQAQVLTAAGKAHEGFDNGKLSEKMCGLMEERRMFLTRMGEKLFEPKIEESEGMFAAMACPVIPSGEVVGAILLCAPEKDAFTDVDKALVQSVAKLLEKQLEI